MSVRSPNFLGSSLSRQGLSGTRGINCMADQPARLIVNEVHVPVMVLGSRYLARSGEI